MSAYLHVQVSIKNADKFKQYAQQAGPTMAPFGAQAPQRLGLVSPLAGSGHANTVVIVKFDSVQTINDWYQSADYQKLIPLRDEAADVVLAIYE